MHKCPACKWEGKTRGALTNHTKKAHADDPTAPLIARYGEFAPRLGGGNKPDRPLRAAPSGIPSIDYAIGIGGVPRGTIMEIYGRPSCLVGDTEVSINVLGKGNVGRSRKVKLVDLYRRWHGEPWDGPPEECYCACGCGEIVRAGKRFKLHHWSTVEPFQGVVRAKSLVDGELRLQPVNEVLFSGVKDTLRLVFQSGKELRVTPDHRIMTAEHGWMEAQYLTPGVAALANGKVVDARGYAWLIGPEWEGHPRASLARVLGIPEHIVVAEENLGRPLREDEISHHKDGNPLNNDPENIQVVSRSEHNRLHKTWRNWHGGTHPINGAALRVIPSEDILVSIEEAGTVPTFDLSMAQEPNFVANGMVVHNSGKTFCALCFSSFAQNNGGTVGFIDAEHALQPTFLELAGVDADRMYYAAPPDGDTALDMTRDYISTGLFDIWTIDSVHALTPRSMLEGWDSQNGNAKGRGKAAALAQLISEGCQVIDHVIAQTDTLCVFINHVKDKPMVQYGRDWFKPGGNALDYYTSVQLRVSVAETYLDRNKRQIGHKVRVKVDKSKVAAPHAIAEMDLYYQDGITKDGKEVHAGVDLASCWFDVLKKAEIIRTAGGQWYLGEDRLGLQEDVYQELANADSDLVKRARECVYSAKYK